MLVMTFVFFGNNYCMNQKLPSGLVQMNVEMKLGMYYYVGHFWIVIKPQHAQKVVAYKSFWTQWSKNFIQREHFFLFYY